MTKKYKTRSRVERGGKTQSLSKGEETLSLSKGGDRFNFWTPTGIGGGEDLRSQGWGGEKTKPIPPHCHAYNEEMMFLIAALPCLRSTDLNAKLDLHKAQSKHHSENHKSRYGDLGVLHHQHALSSSTTKHLFHLTPLRPILSSLPKVIVMPTVDSKHAYLVYVFLKIFLCWI